jgi:hypothetical protein
MQALLRAFENGEIASALAKPVRPDGRIPGSARRLSGEETAELVSAYTAGATVAQLGVQFGLSKGTVGKRLEQAGVVMRTTVRTEEQERMKELFAEGHSLNAIGRMVGRDPKTVRAVLDRLVK